MLGPTTGTGNEKRRTLRKSKYKYKVCSFRLLASVCILTLPYNRQIIGFVFDFTSLAVFIFFASYHNRGIFSLFSLLSFFPPKPCADGVVHLTVDNS